MNTVRFWVWNGSDAQVRLTLHDGETLEHCHGGPTEEGYSWTCQTWALDDGVVTYLVETTASDCDGPCRDGRTLTARAKDLPATAEMLDQTHGEYWHREDSWQHDAFAEAAGY